MSVCIGYSTHYHLCTVRQYLNQLYQTIFTFGGPRRRQRRRTRPEAPAPADSAPILSRRRSRKERQAGHHRHESLHVSTTLTTCTREHVCWRCRVSRSAVFVHRLPPPIRADRLLCSDPAKEPSSFRRALFLSRVAALCCCCCCWCRPLFACLTAGGEMEIPPID